VVNSRWPAYTAAALRRKSETGQYVLMGELGEVQQQFSFRPAGCQDAEHIADRQPGTPELRGQC
jgi:hypothetical protein